MIRNLSNKSVFLITLSGIILYIVFIAIAMFTYPGGTKDNPLIDGYSFWGNTFSDLGRTKAWNEQTNIPSMILFSLAYGINAITLIFFYIAAINIFKSTSLESRAIKIGSLFGILSSIAIIGIIFTPADILYGPHWIFVFIAYPSIFFMGVAYSITLYLQDKVQKSLSYIFAILIIIFFIALIIGLIGISANRGIMVIGQKIMRIVLLIDYCILVYCAWSLEV
jgi:hypothetical protein